MPSAPQVASDTRLTLSPAVVSTSIPDEAVVLDPTSDRYFSLAGVGSRIWELLQAGPTTPGRIAAVISDEYDAEAATVDHDVRVLIDDLIRQGLVVAAGASGA